MSDTKNVSDLSSALLEAISITSNANTSIGASMLEARIKEVVDEGLGIYKVQYLDNIFEATAANRDVTYALDEMVYILVPEGNLDKTRLIVAPVAGYETVYADALNDKFYISLGDDLLGKYINEDDYELSLCSYKTVYPPANFKNSQGSTIDFSGLEDDLKYALADSRVFNFACEIKTAIPADQRNRGNYGLVMTIPLLKDGIENDYVVTLDISNLRGDPYNYEVYAPQNCYFTIPEKTTFNKSKKIKLQYFVKDFIGQSNTMPDDIFIKNITIISTFEATADNMAGYRLKVLASGGNTFYGNYETTSKILSANLYLDGKATKPNNFDCYWFKENVAVNTSHAKYHPLGGIGWEILNELTNVSTINGGDETYQYVTNLYTYTIRGIDILADTNYKCVLVKDGQTVQDTVMIKVINAAIKMNLYSNRVDNTFIENIGNAIISMQYIDTRESIDDIIVSYVWKRFDRFGNLVDWVVDRTLPSIVGQDEDENNIYQSDVILPVSEIDEFTTIKCGVINTFVKDNNTYEKVVGSSSLIVKTTDRVDYSIYIENGDKLYKYDADGDSPLVADYDGPLTSAIKTITPISIRLFKPDGDEFSEGEYAVTTVDWLIPINSMIVINNSLKTDSTTNPGYWTIHGSYESLKSFSYFIANVFDKNKTDNSIIIRAYFKSNEISNVAHIRFLKDGMSGTNGSKYSAIVTYDGYGYGEKDEDGNEVKLQLYYVSDNNVYYWYNTRTKKFKVAFPKPGISSTDFPYNIEYLVPTLYKDGELYSEGIKESVFDIYDKNYNYNNYVDILEIYESDVALRPYGIRVKGERTNSSLNYDYPTVWRDPYQNFASIVAVRISVYDTTYTDSEEYIYAYYPVEVVYVKKASYLKNFEPSIIGGYNEIVYASDGTNPKYDSSSNFKIVNKKENTLDNLYDYQWSVSDYLRINGNSTNVEIAATPETKFDSGQGKNYVKVAINKKDNADAQKQNILDDINKNMQETLNYISYYQVLNENIDVSNIFNYEDAINLFITNQEALIVKSELATSVVDMENKIIQIKNICIAKAGEDENILSLIEEINLVLENIFNLKKLIYKLCYYYNIVDSIKEYTENLFFINLLNNENNNTIYTLINTEIEKYNNYVHNVYTTYLDKLNDNNLVRKINYIISYMQDILFPLLTDERWEKLALIYPEIEGGE